MERKAYTLVLKGTIALDKAVFPKGTSGFALDTLARQFLWEEGLDYRHGTGHGVGSYLVSQHLNPKLCHVLTQPSTERPRRPHRRRHPHPILRSRPLDWQRHIRR